MMQAMHDTPPPSSPAATAATPRRRLLWMGGVGLVALLGGAGLAMCQQRAAPPLDGDAVDASPLWSQRFDRPEGGEPLVLATLRGQPLLVNFWATWCPPCVEELPLLSRFHQAQQAQGKRWQTLGLAIDQPSAVQRFLARKPLAFPVGLAGMGGTDLVRSLGNSAGGLPYTLLLGADGHVLARKMGQMHEADLLQWAALV